VRWDNRRGLPQGGFHKGRVEKTCWTIKKAKTSSEKIENSLSRGGGKRNTGPTKQKARCETLAKKAAITVQAKRARKRRVIIKWNGRKQLDGEKDVRGSRKKMKMLGVEDVAGGVGKFCRTKDLSLKRSVI